MRLAFRFACWFFLLFAAHNFFKFILLLCDESPAGQELVGRPRVQPLIERNPRASNASGTAMGRRTSYEKVRTKRGVQSITSALSMQCR
jgi:hypothetical protein